MRVVIGVLVVILLVLQFHLWVGNGSFAEVWRTSRAIDAQKDENERLRERNAALDAEVRDFKEGLDAIEGRARNDLGMIKEGETFYQIVEKPQ